MLLGYNFEPRSKSRSLGTWGSATSIGLSLHGCSRLMREDKIDQSRYSGCGDLKGFTRFMQSVSFSPPRARRILVIYLNLFLHSSDKASFIFYRGTTTSILSVIHKCLMRYSHQHLNFCSERCKCRFTFVCSVIILVSLCRKGAIFII